MRKNYRRETAMSRVTSYLHETWQNKITAIILVAFGMIGLMVDTDATFLALILFIAIPMFFSNRNWFD